MNHFIALVGMCGAGKSIVADELVSRGFSFFRFGQITLDIVKEQGLKPTEENEKKIREGVRKKHGMGAYAILNQPKIDLFLSSGNVVGDGLYSWDEYKILKEKYGDQLTVICVYAPPKMRYNRLENRKLDSEDTNIRFRPMTKDQAASRDKVEIENIAKGGPIAMADYTLVNTGSVKDLLRQLDDALKEIDKKQFARSTKLSWDEYFMACALLTAKKSKDPNTQVGACIVNKDQKIVGLGYNGFPRYTDDDSFPWDRDGDYDKTKYAYVVHAELNAILNSTKSLEDCTIYVGLFPCNECAKAIIQSGIKEMVYMSDKYKDLPAFKASRKLLESAGIKIRQIELTGKIEIDFDPSKI